MKPDLGVARTLNADLARQLIEQGLRSMRLLDDGKYIKLILNDPIVQYMEFKEERMVSLPLTNANKAA